MRVPDVRYACTVCSHHVGCRTQVHSILLSLRVFKKVAIEFTSAVLDHGLVGLSSYGLYLQPRVLMQAWCQKQKSPRRNRCIPQLGYAAAGSQGKLAIGTLAYLSLDPYCNEDQN